MSTITDPSAAISQLTTVIERAVSDPAYRSALVQSTNATLESAGISIPAGLQVRVAENTDKLRNLVLYAKPSLSSADSQQLETMLGQASAPKTALEAYAKLTIDSWSDSQLRTQLQADAVSVLAKYGISVAAGVSITQLEASDSLAWLSLPSATGSATSSETVDPSQLTYNGEWIVTSDFTNVAKLITASSYLAGLAFAIGSTVKFKQQKDSPTEIPTDTSVALMVIGAMLLFLPSVTTSA